jgi:hypothetical protein
LAIIYFLLLQDDLYTILPILSITELVIILIYLGHISGCFFYLLSTPAWQTKREHIFKFATNVTAALLCH